jgi:hypothetical protein
VTRTIGKQEIAIGGFGKNTRKYMHAETLVVMVTRKFFKNILTNEKSLNLKISLLITKLSISQHIYVRYDIIRNISFNLR